MAETLNYQLHRLDTMTAQQLLAILRLRSEVFVVEQACIYNDPDDWDTEAYHLGVYNEENLVAYARILAPGTRFAEPSIGRVVTAPQQRGKGLGKELMRYTISECIRLFPQRDIRISAQCYLERFYNDLGFVPVSSPYDEDGIPHREMLLPFDTVSQAKG